MITHNNNVNNDVESLHYNSIITTWSCEKKRSRWLLFSFLSFCYYLQVSLMIIVIIIFVLCIDLVQGQLQGEVTVQCYSSAADCTSNTNGVSLAAIDCCNRTGGGYISHSSLAAQCGACVGKTIL